MPNQSRPFAVVVDTSQSRYARLRPVPLTAVTLTDIFWAPRRRLNREVILPAQYHHCEETGRLDNLRRAGGKKEGSFQGFFFNDSDVYKWLEAAAWTLASEDDPDLAKKVDSLITDIAAAQQPDGYLNSYFMFDRAAERWTNLRDMHELYCAGHLIQAAVAHRRTTGSWRLLDIARRLADHICDIFGPSSMGKQSGTGDHPEIEMALVELARITGEEKYKQQAQFFLDQRGQGLIGGREYHQDHQPFRAMEQMAGHAVRALYLNAGAADLYAETGEEALLHTLNQLWQRMTSQQMYINGAVGSRYQDEAFGQAYELPNARAYAETCAAIGSVMWNWRMLALNGEARYADLMEITLYNAVLPGLSLDGQAYFYRNPLANDGTHRRQAWFKCACCPPNIARLLASLPGYFYSLTLEDDPEGYGVWVHLYAQNTAQIDLPDGRTVNLNQHTQYPWAGDITIEVDGKGDFSLWLRIPSWCETGATLTVNEQPYKGILTPGTYAQIHRTWRSGDSVGLHLPMPVRCLESHPYVAENAGRIALMRGPILYCVEQADNPGLDPRDLVVPVETIKGIDGHEPVVEFQPELLDGVVTLRFQANYIPPDTDVWTNRLYRPVQPLMRSQHSQPVEINAIPYYAWANRATGPMQVWLRAEL